MVANRPRSIAHNTLMLYVRMGVSTAIGLYVSRVALQQLGVEDFGVLSVVFGMAVMFGFFSNALNASTLRFLTYAIGGGDPRHTRKVFSTGVNCHILMSAFLIIVTEIVGLWFINHRLNLPPESMGAANTVFQLSLASTILTVLIVPYSSALIACERFDFYALVGLSGSLLKLGAAWLMSRAASDRLVFYSILLTAVSLVQFLLDFGYCRLRLRHICRYRWVKDMPLLGRMTAFAGWNLLRMAAVTGMVQGANILVNIYGGVAASAAMGIANQVSTQTGSFIQTIQTAFNPRITKSVAGGRGADTRRLTMQCCRYSVYLFAFIGVPMAICMPRVLELWLGEAPEGSVTLCTLAVGTVLLDCWTGPLNIAVLARGHIRAYQTIVSLLLALSVPAAWAGLACGVPFRYVLLFRLGAQALTLVYSMHYLHALGLMRWRRFVAGALVRPAVIVSLGAGACLWLTRWMDIEAESSLLVTFLLSSGLLAAGLFSFGLTRGEQRHVLRRLRGMSTGRGLRRDTSPNR